MLSLNYATVLLANDPLLNPENQDTGLPTRVVPGRGTYELKIGTSR